MKAKKEDHLIVGVHITDRVKHAPDVQKVLTEYGEYIKTRLGMNDMVADRTGPAGLILLQMVGEEERADAMMRKLKRIRGVDAKKIIFKHR
jgi:hypothetical protein